MGLLTMFVAYKVGKRRGEKPRSEPTCVEEGDMACSNYESFCKTYGSCDGMECDYE